MQISEIIEEQYKPFSYYVIESRAIPKLADGLKPVERRSLWEAKKIAKDYCKVSKLAGSTMSNHPHGNVSLEDSISSMAQHFAGANNVPFFTGKGTFGSRLTGSGSGCASARYISVKLSENFFKYFDVDSDLVPLIPNFDETDKEPDYFLPIVPAVLLNPTSGIAVGFACEILPRNIEDVKSAQIAYLQGKKISSMTPYYEGFKGKIYKNEEGGWSSKGVWKLEGTKLHISELPIGYNRESFVNILDKLEERDIVKNFTDNCKQNFDFDIVLRQTMTEEDVMLKFKLTNNLNENITLIGFDNAVLEKISDVDVIEKFTKWRFNFYLERYKKKLETTTDELELKKAILLVIEKGLFKKFPTQQKKEIIKTLQDENIKKDHIIKVMQLPIYRFGKDEVDKLKDQIKELENNKKEYDELINDEGKRKNVYINELKK
jgi:DNA gyrase/topoisomerase IV subunit A